MGGAVAPITEQDVRELAAFKGRTAPVTSLYLDVDGRRHPNRKDHEARLARLLKRVQRSAPADDVARIERHVRDVDRKGTNVRGLAMFSCAADGLWRTVELPVPVRDQVVVNHTPHVRQLESALDRYGSVGVLLADRQRARAYVFELGAPVAKSELLDELPRHEDDKGEYVRDQVSDKAAAAAHRHVKRAADLAFELFQRHEFAHLLVGAPEKVASDLEHVLHPYLRDRLAGRVRVAPGASDEEIRVAVFTTIEDVARRAQQQRVDRLRDAVGAGNGGVAGLKAVLAALDERRVDTLFVSDGFEAPGWRCASCGHLAAMGPRCGLCDSAMAKLDDVVEAAIEEALLQSCTVEMCADNADLDVAGRIGALLRF
jgi:peptide subunit release factor 1 (eRF1)